MEYMHSAIGAGKVKRAAQFIQEDGRAFLCAIDGLVRQSAAGPLPDTESVETAGSPQPATQRTCR